MNILDTIVAQKKIEIAKLPMDKPCGVCLKAAMEKRGGSRDFLGALAKANGGSMALIAEVKKASPSMGLICPDFDPVRIAREYQAAGANCLSVLTDEKFFQGSLEYLRQIRAAVDLPLLRKDFIIDERQILEAIEWGADAILLIAAILSDDDLARFHRIATEAGLAALVEAHDEAELTRALALGAPLIGINNRNLKTFTVDLATTERLSLQIKATGNPDRVLLVSESGIHTRQDVERLQQCGARAMLVGESLVTSPSGIRAKAAELLGRSMEEYFERVRMLLFAPRAGNDLRT